MLKPAIIKIMIYRDLLNDLFNPETKKNAIKMFVSGFQHNGFTDRMPLNSDNFTLRLHKPTNSFVNFEFLVSSKSGKYFKPIAIFNSDGVINLFDELKETYKTQNFNTDSTVKFLTTQNNAVIAAFSKETYELAIEILSSYKNDPNKPFMMGGLTKYDREIFVNGMDCEMIFCNQYYPQFFLDDKYGVNGHIGAYIPIDDGINVAPAIAHKQTFDNMKRLGLLTAFSSL